MFRTAALLIAFLLILLMAATATAQQPVGPSHSDTSWTASYWNNTTHSGTPVLVRAETVLDHDWRSGSPHASVKPDGFSARWTRYLELSEGTYRFTATSDDGIRVWVDNELVINEWTDHPVRTVTADRRLTGGHHWVLVEYYENGGEAVVGFTWGLTARPSTSWRGEYFDNPALSGAPKLVRTDAQIDFNWGGGSPAAGTISADRFSARWTHTASLAAGSYRFTVTVDDGARLWVNNHPLIESWRDQPATTYTAEIYLNGGEVPIKLEYYEDGGDAVARLVWELLTPNDQAWQGEYFANRTLSGVPTLVRNDASIDFNWAAGSPAPGALPADGFSARWTRTLDLAAGRYRFEVTADDGGRLWVGGRLLIDVWRDQPAQTYIGEIDLLAGPVPVKMEYYEHTGLAVARLSWSRLDVPSVPGTVMVDDTDPGFVKGGSPTGWRTVSEGYGGRLTWTWNNDWQRLNYNWARWNAMLSSGRYEVFVYIPERYSTTAGARYLVSHAGGTASVVVDQSGDGNRWQSLGTFWFDHASDTYVSLTDVTGEARLTRMIAFDAVKWVPR